MTRLKLVEALKSFIEDATQDMLFPEAVQKGDVNYRERRVEVHGMRLPSSDAVRKYVPYVIVQYLNGVSRQTEGLRTETTGVVRLICCVYSANEEDGAMMLLNLMDRIEQRLLKQVSIGNCFQLDREEGIESISYPDDTAPYYAGEMMMTFKLPSIEREVNLSEF